MAVLTNLDPAALATWLSGFDLGELERVERISTGIENSNFFVDTRQDGALRQFVLTLLEQRLPSRALLVPLSQRLTDRGLPVPRLQADRAGNVLGELAGKPALLATRLPGQHPYNPSAAQCAAIGRLLARMHLASRPLLADAPHHARQLPWLEAQGQAVNRFLPFEEQSLLRRALRHSTSLLHREDVLRLPMGVVHGDLFRDNALFNERGLCGVLDFHHAGRHFLVFDLAVAANDWCTEGSGALDTERLTSLLAGYHSVRPLGVAEQWFMPVMMIYAALCFWLSRLATHYPPGSTPADARKNPDEFRDILEARCAKFVYTDPRMLQARA